MSKLNISATVDRHLMGRLNKVVRMTERNRSWLINRAIESYLEELEDLAIAQERLRDERLSPTTMRKLLRV